MPFVALVSRALAMIGLFYFPESYCVRATL
jgi:hypothetical protein